MIATLKFPTVLTALACIGSLTLVAQTSAAASPPKTPAPCYVLQTDVGFVGGIQPHKGSKYGSVIDVHATVTCTVVQVPGGQASNYTMRLVGEHGHYKGKVLSVAVGRAWLTGDGALHDTPARVIKGYPHRDWVL